MDLVNYLFHFQFKCAGMLVRCSCVIESLMSFKIVFHTVCQRPAGYIEQVILAPPWSKSRLSGSLLFARTF